jgi:hypothetical protein
MPQYQGQFYTGAQAKGDILRQIFEGLRIGRQDGMAARDQRRMELEREQARADRQEQQTYARGRDAKQDEIDEKNRQLARALQLSDLRARGISEGTAPTNPTTSIDLRGLGGVGVSALPDPTRYTPLGEGFYEDRDATPAALAAQHRQTIARIAQKAATGDPSAMAEAVANGVDVSALDPTRRAGTPQYLAAKRAELNLEDEYSARANARQVAGQMQVAGARATQDARAGAVPKLSDVLQFRTQYAGDPTVKAATEVASSVAIARKAAAGDTGISDVSLVYAAAKAFDPGSVVREGEFATIEKSQSIPQRVLSMARRADSGQRLTPEMRADLVRAIEDRGEVARSALQPVRQRFGGMAQTYGLPLDQTVYDPFDELGVQAVPKKPLTVRDVTGLEPRKR